MNETNPKSLFCNHVLEIPQEINVMDKLRHRIHDLEEENR